MTMKRLLPFLLTACFSQSYAQYTATDSHTAEELATELTGDGLVILNPVLSCGDSVNGIFSGSGTLGFNNGVVLSTGEVDQIFQPLTFGAISAPDIGSTFGVDEDMNTYMSSLGNINMELYSACVLEMDVVPGAPTLTVDYVYATGGTQWLGNFQGDDCEDFVDFITIFIKGGIEYTDYKNIATIPGTDIPVNANSIAYDTVGTGGFCPPVEGGPYTEYYGGNDMMDYFAYDAYTTVFSPTAEVTPCDTYHVKIGVADVRWPGLSYETLASSFFLKKGSLRTLGQLVDCPEPVGIEEYRKQQSQIKISPNPFTNSLSIVIEDGSQSGFFHVFLTDIQGRILNSYNGNLTTINNKLQTACEQLSPGMYLLNIKSESGKYNYTAKVVKN